MNTTTSHMPTFGNLLDFVLENKKDKVFKCYTDGQIAYMLDEGIRNNSLYYSLDSNNKISGMILALIDKEDKEVWVEENLSMNIHNLREFARKAKEQYPDYTFKGFKHGRNRYYTKAFKRLTKD